LKQARRAVLIALIISAGINVLMLAVPLYTLQVFESVVPTGSLETLAVLSVMVGAAIVALALVEFYRDRILLRAGLWLDHVLGQHMLENGLAAGSTPTDLEADRNALATLRGFLVSPTLAPMLDAPWVPVFMIVLTLMHPWLGTVGMTAAIGLVGLALVHNRATRRAQLEGSQATERTSRWWSAATASPGEMSALGLVGPATDAWERCNRQHIAAHYALGKRTSAARAMARTIRTGAQIAMYGIGAWLVVRSELAPGALVAAAIMLARALGPLEGLVGGLKSLQLAAASYARLKSLPSDTRVRSIGTPAMIANEHLIADDVTVFHPGRRTPALRSVTLAIAPGEIVGVVGPSSAGKSSLIAAFAGALVPASGAASLGGIAVPRWRASGDACPIGYLPDEPVILEGSVHENICRFSTASLMSVANAAIKAGAHEVISDLPNGYDTEAGPRGTLLAARERRAVAFARALFDQPRFLVLDEPEIGLDAPGIQRLLLTLRDLKTAGVGIVLATQDQRLVRLCDRIAVLDAGALKTITAAADLQRAPSNRPDAAPQSIRQGGA
jgi:PrtD family type I secretion system ABC transporter